LSSGVCCLVVFRSRKTRTTHADRSDASRCQIWIGPMTGARCRHRVRPQPTPATRQVAPCSVGRFRSFVWLDPLHRARGAVLGWAAQTEQAQHAADYVDLGAADNFSAPQTKPPLVGGVPGAETIEPLQQLQFFLWGDVLFIHGGRVAGLGADPNQVAAGLDARSLS
jgi:hypothetical protein